LYGFRVVGETLLAIEFIQKQFLGIIDGREGSSPLLPRVLEIVTALLSETSIGLFLLKNVE
jgi:hypothetical protein